MVNPISNDNGIAHPIYKHIGIVDSIFNNVSMVYVIIEYYWHGRNYFLY